MCFIYLIQESNSVKTLAGNKMLKSIITMATSSWNTYWGLSVRIPADCMFI